jgi:hypothetical protein
MRLPMGDAQNIFGSAYFLISGSATPSRQFLGAPAVFEIK